MAAPKPPPPSGAPQTPLSVSVPDASMQGMPCRFGKYTLIRRLATGGMAELFLAIQKSVAGFEKLIVIKRILPILNQDRAFIEMLLHEARVAATMSHPNIVQIFDVGAVDGSYFIAMEHVHGEDLRSIVRQMRKSQVLEFPLEHALSIVLGVCAGLSYAHEKRDLDGTPLNIVHRDISPQNVVVTFTGDVKIVDFGIAKSDTNLQEHATRSGKLKGKIPYMSPEQARGEPIDWRTDIFATGVMLFELTTGKRLFKGASEYETLRLICDRDYPSPSQVRFGYPRELEAIVMRALAKDRQHRWQSAREFQGALEEFVRRERLGVSTIALSQFMQSLFEEKLATQKEALLQGKQLADIIALQAPDGPADSATNVDTQGSTTSTPAMRSLASLPSPKSRSGLIAGAIGMAAALSAAVGAVWWVKHREPSAASQSAAESRGALAIASDPPGAAIFINGERRPEKTPASIGKLALGVPYLVALSKDGFQETSQTVTLSDQQPSGAVSMGLQRATLTIDVGLNPPVPAATVVLDNKPYPSTTVDKVTAGESHQLVVQAPGYAPQSLSFVGAPDERKHFDVALARLDAPHPADRPIPRAGPAPAMQAPPPAAAATATGKLNVNARGGWCNVTIDGTPRGPTPIAGVVLPAGSHQVVCTPEGGKPMAASVRVDADSTARYAFSISQL
jgi:serine/threonine-protein kinase